MYVSIWPRASSDLKKKKEISEVGFSGADVNFRGTLLQNEWHTAAKLAKM